MEKTRYWLKLEKNFLTLPEIKILRKKGFDVVMFYIALMLESTPTLGHLRLSDSVPYDNELLAEAFGFDEDVIENSMNCYKKLGLVEILENGTIFMTKVPDMTGNVGESAKRVRDYRAKKYNAIIDEKIEDDSSPEEGNATISPLQCNDDVTNSNKKKENVTKCNDNIYIQSKLTTTEYINKINNVDSKLINKINNSCSCCLEENDVALKIVFNWVQKFKNNVLEIIDRAIEIMSLNSNVENKLFYVNGILKNWFMAKCQTIDDIDKCINYSIYDIDKDLNTSAVSEVFEELKDYNWLEDENYV